MFFFQIFGWFELLQWSLACLLVSLISFYSLYIPDNVNLAIFRYFLNYFVVIYFLRLWNTPARWNFIFLLRIICCFTFFFNILCLKELSSQDCFILGKNSYRTMHPDSYNHIWVTFKSDESTFHKRKTNRKKCFVTGIFIFHALTQSSPYHYATD